MGPALSLPPSPLPDLETHDFSDIDVPKTVLQSNPEPGPSNTQQRGTLQGSSNDAASSIGPQVCTSNSLVHAPIRISDPIAILV